VSDTLLAVLIGGALTFAGGAFVEIVRNISSSRREQRARDAARQDRLDEVQRSTLLELQSALAEWMRAETRIDLADLATLASHGKLFLLPEELSDTAFETGRRLMYLTERVRDDELRAMLNDLRSWGAIQEIERLNPRHPATEKSVDGQMTDLGNRGAIVQTRLGTALRSLL
jgi:hypothetical protein